MQKDLITVVMPTYNDEKYLRRAIDDILKQTYSNFEMLIVNDGSTDNTAQILEQYSQKDNRIKVFHKENGGTGSALNHGFKHANGEFGTWVSSDDYKEPDYLEQLVTLLKDNRDVEFVCSAFYSAYLKSNVRAYIPDKDRKPVAVNLSKNINHLRDKNCTNQAFIVDDWCKLNFDSCMLGVCFMFTMRLKKKLGEYLEAPGEDYYMAMKAGMLSRVGYIDKVLGSHNNPPDSLSMQNRECVMECNYKAKTMFLKSEKWNMEKIPKVANFYWGSDSMSFLRYMTIYSFKKQNPSWSIHLYVPKHVSSEIYWRDAGDKHHQNDQTDYDGKCYFEKLIHDVPIKIIKVDFSKSFIGNKAPEPHKSDLLTWVVLSKSGGLWCDMDIIFNNPITKLNINKDTSNFISDTIVCYDNNSRHPDGTPGKPIGFLFSSGKNSFYNYCLALSKKSYTKEQYQSIGTYIIHKAAATFEKCKNVFYSNKFCNVDSNSVYKIGHQKIADIYEKDIYKQIKDEIIGIHWFGGHPMSQKYNNLLTHENYKNFNSTICSIIEEVLS